ncbi:MAG: putative glycosyl transferase [Planctomycetota bacterium]|nr:putative glycosyl transferase [Planctomycetota bacterium]
MAVADYYNRVNPDLLRLIPPDARVVLEIGCGAAAMADQYRRVNPGVQYVGVEMNAEAADLAKERLDRVIVGDVASLDIPALGLTEGSVDVLVFGDVLEHMLDPWAVLKRLTPLLREGGQAVACIPNIQHWSVLVDLLQGRWDYQDEGLLDRTHLRFFAAESLRPMFAGAGLTVFDVQPRFWPTDQYEKFQQVMAPVVQMMGLDPVQFSMRTQALQYIVRAVRASEPPEKLAIQTLIAEPLVCARVRVLEPDRFLGTIPGVRTIAATDANMLGQALADEAKVFVRQRNIIIADAHLAGQAALARLGYLIVAEFDDDPGHFKDIEANRFLTFSACHCVQTSTDVLAEALRPYNPHVKVFANQMAALPPPRPERPPGPITLFFGALNREPDWAPILPALNRILAERGDSIRVRVVYDWAFYDAIETEFKDYEKFCAYDHYTEILRSADIALLPLNPTRFNACKSDLKYIECAAHGTIALASPTVYGATLHDGETGLLFESPAEFEAKLNRLIDDHSMRRLLAENAYRYVARNRLLSQHFHERYDWYRAMLDHLPELNRELRKRVPEMFGASVR